MLPIQMRTPYLTSKEVMIRAIVMAIVLTVASPLTQNVNLGFATYAAATSLML